MRTRTLLSGAVGALIATALAGGLASAALPGAGGVINGCYQKVEGQLRVIDSASDSCRVSEVATSWNEQGVQGGKGDPGAPGRDGRDGTGVTVASEPAGVNCPTGGMKLTAANGVAYLCNVLPPDPGRD
jgi:hypothetical protein